MEYKNEEGRSKEIREYIYYRRQELSKCNQFQLATKRNEIINDAVKKFGIPPEYAETLVELPD